MREAQINSLLRCKEGAMKNWMMVAILMVFVAGPEFALAQNEAPPTPPSLEYASAWVAEEYAQKFEGHNFLLNHQSPDLGNWETVRYLRKGTKIRVVDAALKKTKANFIEASEQQLTFKANGKVVTLERDKVRIVSQRFGPSTGERILLGILAGALIGASAYAEARMCEKGGCWDDTYGWYEGSGKAPSARSAYFAMGVGAASLGFLAAFAETEDAVIYFQPEPVALIEMHSGFDLAPFDPSPLEGGNVFAPVTRPPEDGSGEVEE
jgi:hypothetical protein